LLKQVALEKGQDKIDSQSYSSSQPLDPEDRQKTSWTNIDRKWFDSTRLDLFWWFLFERQTIWRRRWVEKKAPPWTNDPILRTARFTNVYRELDPGTDYLIRNILETSHSDQDKIFNVMVYRLIGRLETFKRIGFQSVDSFDSSKFEEVLKQVRDVEGSSPFSGAYTVCAYSKLGSHDKVENVARLFSALQDRFPNLYARIKKCRRAEEAYNELKSTNGFGRFLSYQVLVDLLYPLNMKNGEPLLPFSHDEWAIAGPGARKGIDFLLKDKLAPKELDVMRWLRYNQRQEFERVKLSFPYRKDKLGRPIELTLANIQNCLCEYYKYYKIKTGTGRARRNFVPRTQQLLEAIA